MKKLVLLSVFAFAVLGMNAQTSVLEGAGFWDNWFMGYRSGATMKMSGAPFIKSARPAMGLSIGKQWTPILGTEIQGLGYINTTKSKTMIDASEVSLITNMNLMNLFGSYEGMPRAFEIETATGLGWLHHYAKGADDTNDMSARVGLNLNFNLGESKAWTFSLRPAVVYNLTGNFPQEKLAFDKDRSRFEMLIGFTYHFANSDGQRHFAMVSTVDPLAMAAMNEEINVLRETVAAQEAAIAASALEIADLQSSLNDCQDAANNTSAPAPTNILEAIVSFAFNQAVIQHSQMPTIERIATYLKDNPGVNAVINGYASPEGTEDYNMKLSQRRAEAMKEVLVDKYGIEASRIEAIGHGIGDIFSDPAWNRVGICTIELK